MYQDTSYSGQVNQKEKYKTAKARHVKFEKKLRPDPVRFLSDDDEELEVPQHDE